METAVSEFNHVTKERERYEEAAAAKEQAARLQATNAELRRRVDELMDEAQRAARQPQPQPQTAVAGAGAQQDGAAFDWHLAEIARLEREVCPLHTCPRLPSLPQFNNHTTAVLVFSPDSSVLFQVPIPRSSDALEFTVASSGCCRR